VVSPGEVDQMSLEVDDIDRAVLAEGGEYASAMLFLDDQADDYMSLARRLSESINGSVVICREGNEAARLVPRFSRLLLDIGAGDRLDAGYEWLDAHANQFGSDLSIVVFTQYLEVAAKPERLRRHPGFKDVVLKSLNLREQCDEILGNLGLRRTVEAFLESYDPDTESFELMVPGWSSKRLVELDGEKLIPLLSKGNRFRSPNGIRGLVVVGQANIYAVDSEAVQFEPSSIEGTLPLLSSRFDLVIPRPAE